MASLFTRGPLPGVAVVDDGSDDNSKKRRPKGRLAPAIRVAQSFDAMGLYAISNQVRDRREPSPGALLRSTLTPFFFFFWSHSGKLSGPSVYWGSVYSRASCNCHDSVVFGSSEKSVLSRNAFVAKQLLFECSRSRRRWWRRRRRRLEYRCM